MIKSDYHMHTDYSMDGVRKMSEMVEKAIELGLSYIAITDHEDFYHLDEKTFQQKDYNAYYNDYKALKEKYADKINIAYGIEIGLTKRYYPLLAPFIESHDFDFIIGSSHEFNGYDIYSHKTEIQALYTKEQICEMYFTEVLQNIVNAPKFSVYGHFDYILRYSTYADKSLKYSDYKEVIDAALKELVNRGIGLEINMSGFRYGLNAFHPQADILKQYKKLGGEILTIGSDAHDTCYIGENFHKVPAFLQEIGFNAYTVFIDKKPVFINL